MSRLRQLMTLATERDAAMQRARWCRQCGYNGVAVDVQIARRFNRQLVAMLSRRCQILRSR